MRVISKEIFVECSLIEPLFGCRLPICTKRDRSFTNHICGNSSDGSLFRLFPTMQRGCSLHSRFFECHTIFQTKLPLCFIHTDLYVLIDFYMRSSMGTQPSLPDRWNAKNQYATSFILSAILGTVLILLCSVTSTFHQNMF